jgi:hypothetical protein
VLAALIVLVVTLTAVGATLFEASHRYRISQQSGRWAQAGQAAEAGAEVALMTAQKNSWTTDGWSAAPGAPGTSAVTKTVTLSTGVPATGPVTTRMAVDKITMGSSEWLRIRATGVADVAGGARAAIDTRDVLLRKLNLRVDRTTGAAVTAPQAARMVEILAEPIGKSPYVRALLLDKKFTMSGGGWIDSFDSSDPAKSTSGLYDVAKRQSHGNVGVNDTQGASDLKDTFVYGDVAYSGPPIQGTTNVQGTLATPFAEPTTPVPAPSWTTFNPTPTVIGSSMTLTGGPQTAPARYKVSSVTVPGGNVLTIAPHAAGQESYVEVWVTGKFTTSGSGYIVQAPGVHVTYHIEGDITVSGSSFNNQSNIAANNIINAITPPVGTNRKVTVSGGGTFVGAINAPGSDFTISGSAIFSGALIGKTMNISGGASLHYDEALARFTGSGGSGAYRVASWVEAVR